ncbi:DoxX family protein [archaeon]|jgi:uncharacterized membrane protein YphA (DoxX/SURF4 family)|nr:DoxX family protein [archaeon]
MKNNKTYGITILRIALGLLFLIPGLGKLMNPAGITGMLGGLGFPIAGFFAWILIISEIVFGTMLIFNWKTDLVVWPLFIILLVATLLVSIPGIDMSNPSTIIGLLWHLVGMSALISLPLTRH